MSWETIGLLILVLIGYSHLLSASKKRSVSALVRVYLESKDKDEYGVPEKNNVFTKTCPFIVTPVPGMEFMPAGIETAEIKRVVTDEYGY